MAAPAVTGAVALYKASRPLATPTEVRESLRYLGNLGWKTSTDPDSIHEPLLDVHRVAALGTFRVVAPTTAYAAPLTGGHDRGPRDGQPQLELLRAGSPQLQRRAGRLVRHVGGDEPVRVDGQEHHGHDQRPGDGEGRHVQDQGRRHQLGSHERIDDHGPGRCDAVHRRRRLRRPDRVAVPVAGITGGCSPTLFCPKGKVTRAQMAMFLDRALDLPAATTDYFDDDDGKTGEGSINALAKARITGGCGPRRFCPTAYVTRAQMAMFLDRALALPNATTDYFDDDDGKTGEGSINALAQVRASPAAAAPAATARRRSVTREQMAAFLYRAHLQGRLD